MTRAPAPQRLVHDPELGNLVAAAAGQRMSDERLAANLRAVEAALGGVVVAAGVASVAGVGAKGALGLPALAAKLGLALVVGVGASVVVYQVVESRRSSSVPPAVHVAPAAVLAPADPPPAVEPAPTPVAKPPALRSTHARRAQPVAPKGSALAAQLELFHAAQAEADAGRTDRALARLSELDRRYPHGALEAEVLLTRAEVIFRAGRDAEAARVIEQSLDSAMVGPRKAELWMMLGDIRTRQGDCPQATAAYQRALGLGLEPEAAESARQALRRCAP
jgi:hypothetical protein